jgi:hypothetical protein
LHRRREFSVRATKLFQQHFAELWIWFADFNRIHKLLDVVIHVVVLLSNVNRSFTSVSESLVKVWFGRLSPVIFLSFMSEVPASCDSYKRSDAIWRPAL